MNLLLVATELAPFVTRTETAEAVSSLARALRLLGHEVTLVLPRLAGFEGAGLMVARRLTPLSLPGGVEAHVYEASLPSGARLVLLDSSGVDWNLLSDSSVPAETLAPVWGRFSDAVAALVAERGESETALDVIHLHDASAGFVLHKLRQRGVEIPVVLTVHDASRSGEFSVESAAALGLDTNSSGAADFRVGSGVSVLQGILPLADGVLVPSASYASALESAARFGALSTAFHGNPAIGVLGGVDHAVFNPSTDTALPHRYDAEDTSNKARCKTKLQDELGLRFDVAFPLFFFDDAEPGSGALELVLSNLVSIVRLGAGIVIASSRPPSAAESEVLASFPDEVKVLVQPDAKQRRRLLAGTDFYVGLEKNNPSGARIQKAARYGSIPVALAVDAGRDTIVDADAELKTGTGIVFEEATAGALLGALGRAVAAFRADKFSRFQARVMRQDLAWDRAARRHVQIYRQVGGAAR